MSAGIYLNNGVYAYAMDLDKKLRRRKSATIVEEYKGVEGDVLLGLLVDDTLKAARTMTIDSLLEGFNYGLD